MADVASRKRAREQQAAAINAANRVGQLPYPLDELLGEWVFIEGIRINYFGILRGALDVFGAVHLQLEHCHRVGDFNTQGLASFEVFPDLPIIPLDFCHFIGAAPAHWNRPE